jgi:natural product biosynthesis luciferase-like monooxygenase protein
MRFGAHYTPTYVPELDGPVGEYYRRMFEQIELLDTLGYQDAWVTEHHFHEYGGTLPHPPTFLAAVARSTRRIRLGVAISVLPLHNPLQVAEEYAMLDVIADGRLEFGVGRGSTPPEYDDFRISQADSAVRMREMTDIIRQAWTADTVSFRGECFEYENVKVLPKPVQQPPPIWVGASRSDDTFRWAGDQGYHLMTLPYMYDLPVIQQQIAIYREALAAAGHDPASREVLGKFHIYVAENDRTALDEATPYIKNYERVAAARMDRAKSRTIERQNPMRERQPVAQEFQAGTIIGGSPERCIEAIQRWQETLGLTSISGTFYFGGLPQELALRNIRLFAERVMPAFPTAARPATAAVAASAS